MQQNRFKAFSDSDNDHSDEEEQQTTSKSNKPVDPRTRAEKRKVQKQKEETAQAQANALSQAVEKEAKKQKSDRERQQPKGVSAEPHPLDKHSGSGLKTHDRKGGAGKANWGTYKDDVKEAPKDSETEVVVQEAQQPEEEEQLNLQEYLAKIGVTQKPAQQAQQQKKGNQDYTSFIKEGCQIIEKTAEVDDKNPTKKKQINDKYIGMQNTDLLGFRTGLKTYALREEKPEGEFKRERQERAPRQPKVEAENVENAQKQEGELVEIAQKQEGSVDKKQDNGKKPYRNNRDGGRQNNRGGYQGGQRKGGNYKGNQKSSVGVNLEDDSLFPKLG